MNQIFRWDPFLYPDQRILQSSDSIVIDAIDYIIDHGIRLSNNSYYGPYSQNRYYAMSAAEEAGHLFVCAAGNDANDNDVTPFYPASYDLPNIISVAATNNDDELADFGGTASGSNYGELSVDLGAPGMAIESTSFYDNSHPNYYGWMNGTSMAAPHVTGVAALVWSLNPQWDYATVKDQILDSVRPAEALDGITVTGGVVDAFAAINDCNRNGIGDDEDVAEETSEDCNENYWPDECDIARGTSEDCDENDVPDECQTDCNNNDVPDVCDIANQTSDDCEPNGVPDECESRGACCFDGGPPCTITTAACCQGEGDEYFGNGSTCHAWTCGQIGAPNGP